MKKILDKNFNWLEAYEVLYQRKREKYENCKSFKNKNLSRTKEKNRFINGYCRFFLILWNNYKLNIIRKLIDVENKKEEFLVMGEAKGITFLSILWYVNIFTFVYYSCKKCLIKES